MGFRLSDEMTEAVAQRFRVLGDTARLRILQILEDGEKTVSQIVEAVDANQPTVSRHLGILFDVGLLDRRRDGNNIYYSIGDPMVLSLCDLVCTSAREHAREKLHALTGKR
jgi:DNA-binding transcriptional ArsR family regulator